MTNPPNDPVALTQALVRIASVNPHYDPSSCGETGVVEYLSKSAAANGFGVTQSSLFDGRNNLCIRLRNGAEHPHLLFNGHSDTVGVSGMTIPPFDATLHDGKIWGRGSTDMKGALASMLCAMLRLRDDRKNWRGTVTLAVVVDEEYLFRGIREYLKSGERADFAVVGEPTNMSVVRGCKGVLRFSVTAIGRAVHSSTPHLGRSAIVAISEAVLALEQYFENMLSKVVYPEFGSSTGSVGVITGGAGINVVPEACTIQVDVRIVPGQSWEATYAEIQKLIPERVKRPDIGWKFELIITDPSFETPAEHALVKAACNVAGEAKAGTVMYGSDASKLAEAGIATVIFGPGDIAQAHTADEFLDVQQLHLAVERYEKLARTLLCL